VVDANPSHREQKDGPRAASTVTVYPDGPLVLRGDFEVRGVDGVEVPTGRVVALCRCGRSAVKPMCDGSHKNATAKERPTHRARD
jgi:CDGSH-type Zn-finger protein